jgi:hypothetical protein
MRSTQCGLIKLVSDKYVGFKTEPTIGAISIAIGRGWHGFALWQRSAAILAVRIGKAGIAKGQKMLAMRLGDWTHATPFKTLTLPLGSLKEEK